MTYPTRKGYRLKPEWEQEYTQFRLIHGREGNCSCHLCAPCGSCSHDGHPSNIEACDEAWEPEELDFEEWETTTRVMLKAEIKAHASKHLFAMACRSSWYSYDHNHPLFPEKVSND